MDNALKNQDTSALPPPVTSATKRGADAIDVHVGGRLRLRRVLQGWSQVQLGNALGLTFQQIQKYEHGTNRISASMLFRAAEALDVPISFFFDGLLSAGQANPSPAMSSSMGAGTPILSRDMIEFAQICAQLPADVRQGLFDVVRATSRMATAG